MTEIFGSRTILEDTLEEDEHNTSVFTAYHPQTNGQIEVVDHRLENLLRCLVIDHLTNCDLVLFMVEFTYNSSVNRSTSISPFEIVTSCRPRKPIDLLHVPLSLIHI